MEFVEVDLTTLLQPHYFSFSSDPRVDSFSVGVLELKGIGQRNCFYLTSHSYLYSRNFWV
jgi:hypothetical protein